MTSSMMALCSMDSHCGTPPWSPKLTVPFGTLWLSSFVMCIFYAAGMFKKEK
jgi:hypothetical protein